MIGSPEPLRGFHFDKDKMELQGLTLDGRLIDASVAFTQTHYIGQSGKEKVITRVQDKVIPYQADLIRYLSSSFDLIIAVDTNTKVIDSETLSVTGVAYCVVEKTTDPDRYKLVYRPHGVILFRNCPSELPSEKFGWMTVIKGVNSEPKNKIKKFAIVTDHDLDNHIPYNTKRKPIFKDFYLPDNFTFMYARGDGPSQNLLNDLVKQCDKESTEVFRMFEQTGYYQHGGKRYSINQIPVPGL